MKFLVLGSNGMAGHQIAIYLQERGHDVTGFARSRSPWLEKSVVGDATDFALLCRLVGEGTFDVVVNCIGLLNQFAENNMEQAVLLNGYLPHFLAETVEGIATRIFHMSTDCVFSGSRGGYTETDMPDGTTVYDRSKALGELNDSHNLTLRNSIVGPDVKQQGIGLLNWFMQQHGTVKGFTKAIWTGQTTLQLAKTMEAAAREGLTGLINAVPRESITKYELLKLFNKHLRGNSLKIEAVEGVNADKSLIRTRNDFAYEIPDYETMVAEMGEWMRGHKKLYPHYNL